FRRLDPSQQHCAHAGRQREPDVPRARGPAPVSFNAALLRALAPGGPVSGEALGRELNISRAAVWKAVRRLVELGVPIEALPGRGYRLDPPLVPLDADAVRRALPTPVARRI